MKVELDRKEITKALEMYVTGLFANSQAVAESVYGLPMSLTFNLCFTPEDAAKARELEGE